MKKLFTTFLLLLAVPAFAWVGPTTPPPGGNTPAPVNTGTVSQEKSGFMIVGNSSTNGNNLGLLTPKRMAADEFCFIRSGAAGGLECTRNWSGGGGGTGGTGPAGPAGPAGADGAQGPQGLQGLRGPAGDLTGSGVANTFALWNTNGNALTSSRLRVVGGDKFGIGTSLTDNNFFTKLFNIAGDIKANGFCLPDSTPECITNWSRIGGGGGISELTSGGGINFTVAGVPQARITTTGTIAADISGIVSTIGICDTGKVLRGVAANGSKDCVAINSSERPSEVTGSGEAGFLTKWDGVRSIVKTPNIKEVNGRLEVSQPLKITTTPAIGFTLQDGSQADKKVLASDDNGNARWKTLEELGGGGGGGLSNNPDGERNHLAKFSADEVVTNSGIVENDNGTINIGFTDSTTKLSIGESRTLSPFDHIIYALNTAGNYGLRGEGNVAGVFGRANNRSDAYGVMGSSGQNGIAGYFITEPTRAAGNGGTGNGTAIQIIDGSQGEGKVLTSDASGKATWKQLDTVPNGAIMLFGGDCPVGWTYFNDMEGRFPLGDRTAGKTQGTAGATTAGGQYVGYEDMDHDDGNPEPYVKGSAVSFTVPSYSMVYCRKNSNTVVSAPPAIETLPVCNEGQTIKMTRGRWECADLSLTLSKTAPNTLGTGRGRLVEGNMICPEGQYVGGIYIWDDGRKDNSVTELRVHCYKP